MKSLFFVSGLATLALVGCAANQHALSRSMEQTEGTRAVATEIKADSATVESANAHLDSAKAYMEQKKAQEALAAPSVIPLRPKTNASKPNSAPMWNASSFTRTSWTTKTRRPNNEDA